MSRVVTPVSNTQSFDQWVAATNNVISALLDTVTVAANSTGDSTSGNGFVIGAFGANVIVGSTIRGGTVATSGPTEITSNVAFTGSQINSTANVHVQAANVQLKSNSSIVAVHIAGNTTATTITVGGTTVNVEANVALNGKVLRIPVTNNSARPTAANGMIIYNSEMELLQVASNNEWQIVSSYANTLAASAITFSPSSNVSANNVQDALTEVYNEKLSLSGGNMTGSVIFDMNGVGLPAPPAGYVLQGGTGDGSNTTIILDSFAGTTTFVGRRADGSNGSKNAVANNMSITKVSGIGHDGNTYHDQVGIDLRTRQAWTNTAHGTAVYFRVTPVGSVTVQEAMHLTSNTLTTNTSIVANGNITGVSDARFKKNVVTIQDALEKVRKMRGVWFDDLDGNHKSGVIAQELQQVAPELVQENEGGVLSVAYGNGIGYLIEAIKELCDVVDAMAERIEELEG